MSLDTLWSELLAEGTLVPQGWLTASAGVEILRLPDGYLVKQKSDWITSSPFESAEDLDESVANKLLVEGAARHGLRVVHQQHRAGSGDDIEISHYCVVYPREHGRRSN